MPELEIRFDPEIWQPISGDPAALALMPGPWVGRVSIGPTRDGHESGQRFILLTDPVSPATVLEIDAVPAPGAPVRDAAEILLAPTRAPDIEDVHIDGVGTVCRLVQEIPGDDVPEISGGRAVVLGVQYVRSAELAGEAWSITATAVTSRVDALNEVAGLIEAILASVVLGAATT